MNRFYFNGGLGDLIYALPMIKDLGGGEIYMGVISVEMFEFAKPLFEFQDCVKGFYHTDETDATKGFIDISKFYQHPQHLEKHLVNVHREYRGLEPYDFNSGGWLRPMKNDLKIWWDYAVVNITPRYRDKFFHWRREIKRLVIKYGVVYFIGFEKDYHAAKLKPPIFFMTLKNALEGAKLVQNAKEFSGTESFWLSVRQGLGLSYNVEKHPFANHVITHQPHEKILNPITSKIHRSLSLLKQYTIGHNQKNIEIKNFGNVK